MTDREIYICWRKHDDKRVGKRGTEDRSAFDEAAEELGIPSSRVRDVVFAREFNWFAG